MAKNRRSGIRSIATALTTVLALAACGGGNGGGAVAPPPPPPPPPPPAAAFGPNFSEIQSAVFTPTCATAGCHSGAGSPQGLNLSAASSYGLLVGVASGQMPGIMRVAEGDPDNSYLIQKLEGNAGTQMPLNRTPLPQIDIDVIRQWITDGAIDDRVQADEPIRVTSLSPLPQAMLDDAPANITAMFDRDPDPSTVNANTFILEGSGGDGTFSEGNEVPITAASISVPAGNTATAVFDLTGVAVPDDAYRVRLLGDGASVILDMDANALDGEFGGTFPSGDGAEGGDFSATFDIMAPVQMGPTLADIQATVFTPSCSSAGCHSGPSGNSLPSGMNLTSTANSFADLVGVASIQQPGIMRIAAGDPDNSYLVQKIEGTAAAPNNSRMPLGGAALPQNVIDDVRQWIANGAQQ